jgi:hemerythrin-like domain-containing protein
LADAPDATTRTNSTPSTSPRRLWRRSTCRAARCGRNWLSSPITRGKRTKGGQEKEQNKIPKTGGETDDAHREEKGDAHCEEKDGSACCGSACAPCAQATVQTVQTVSVGNICAWCGCRCCRDSDAQNAGASTQPDAIEILEREHRRFEELLKQGEQSTEQARKMRRELLATLTAELNRHELMEETVLYPALQTHPETREVVLEGFAEHHIADVIVEELNDVAPNDEVWGAKFKVLKENVKHHIQEEEGTMFRFARGIFSREELRDLGARMLKSRRTET